jgi:D-cysteine desulfhydrase
MSLSRALSLLPRRDLLEGPTPIQRLHRVENALGSLLNGVRIYAKRDDLMSLGGGGNKLRKLEFLLGDAAAAGADTIIATGGRQSNFARLTAAAAAKLGLACELVLSRMVPRSGSEYDRNATFCSMIFSALASTIYLPESIRHVSRSSGPGNCV